MMNHLMGKRLLLSAAAIGVCASGYFIWSSLAQNHVPLDNTSLFSDTTPQFVSPAEPKKGQPFVLRIRVGKGEAKNASVIFNETSFSMRKVKNDEWFDYYEGTIPGQSDIGTYYFKLDGHAGTSVYYSIRGASVNAPASSDYFTIVPGYQTPNWAKGAVFYQIFPDRFYNGDKSNDVLTNEYLYDGHHSVKVTDWSKYPDGTPYQSGGNRTSEFYGGDLQGIIDKLPYLKQLGIEALYLNPIFVSPSNHKYDTQDYDHVDPHLGTISHDGGQILGSGPNESKQKPTKYIVRTEDQENLSASDKDLANLIAQAHKMGMKVVLDGVFNHTGNFNKWFDASHIYPDTTPLGPGAFESENSPSHAYYSFNSNHWPNNQDYDSWQGFSTLPKLNYENSKKLVQTVYGVAQKWMEPPYSADGWRLDSAGDLGYSSDYNLKFWQGFHQAVKSVNQNALILAEYYKDPALYFYGNAWDSMQNYNAFLTPVSLFLTGMEVHSQDKDYSAMGNVSGFLDSMESQMEEFPYPSLFTAMNALDNHDVSRFLTRTNGEIGSDDLGNNPAQASQNTHMNVLTQGVVLDMTWPGAPTVYYGDEAGVAGWTDPDDRRSFPWSHMNMELESFYQQLIHLHEKYSCFKTGSLVSFPPEGKNQVLAYGRFDASSASLVAVNTSDSAKTAVFPAWEVDSFSNAKWDVITIDGISSQKSKLWQKEKEIQITVPAGGAVVLVESRN